MSCLPVFYYTFPVYLWILHTFTIPPFKLNDYTTDASGTNFTPVAGVLDGSLSRTWKIQFYTGGAGTWAKLGNVQTYTVNFD